MIEDADFNESEERPAPANGFANGHAKQMPLKLWWHGEEPAASCAWLVDGLLPTIGVALLSGQWGLYKSFTAIDLAVAVMLGGSFAGHAVTQRVGVIYIAREGAPKIPDRLQAAYEARGGNPHELLPFAMAAECPPLLSKDAHAQLDETVKVATARMFGEFGVEPGLIVIDTMAACAGVSDETDNAEAQKAMNVLTELAKKHQCLVLAVDHFGKVVDNGTRGASAKESAADVVLAMLGERSTSGTVSNARMAVRKARDGSSGVEKPFAVKLVDVNDERKTLVIDWNAAPPPPATPAAPPGERPPSAGMRIFGDALTEALFEGNDSRPYADGPMVRVVPIDRVRDVFNKRYPADGDTDEQRRQCRKNAFRRALDQAIARRQVATIESGGYALIWRVTPASNDNFQDTVRTQRAL